MNNRRARSVDEAFSHLARDFSDSIGSGDKFYSTGSPFFGTTIRQTTEDSSPDKDKPMLELEVHLTIDDPRHRLVYSKPVDIFNCVGQWIYLMSGSENVGPISFYNQIARRFVDEGVDPVRLRATWGSRLFGTGAISRVISLLRVSPQTRRAVIPVLWAEDVGYSSRNLPCLASIQFAVKNGALDCFVTMRSQAAIGVMPYDLFLLTMLHEYVAMKSDIELGKYHHYAPLCGVRESEIPTIRQIVKDHTCAGTEPMLPMEKLEPGQLALFHYAERIIRREDRIVGEAEDLPPYWYSFLAITKAKSVSSKPFNDPRDSRETWITTTAKGAFPEGWLRRAADWSKPRWAVQKP